MILDYRKYYKQIFFKDPLIKFIFLLLSNNENLKKEVSPPFQGCSLNNTNGTIGGYAPIVLNTDGPELTLVHPYNGSINVETSKNFIVVCPGLNNALISTNINENEAICDATKKVNIDGQLHSFENMTCKKSVSADLEFTNTKCGLSGKELFIGYRVQFKEKQHFVKLMKVCYNMRLTITLYTEHTLYGSNIKYATRSTPRPFFSIRGLGTANVHGYKRFMQKAIFAYLLGSERLAQKYINFKSFLSRGHLSPHADFLLGNTQRSSYFYLNACPQWQSINGGNWNILEMTIRRTSELYNKTLTVLTGIHDVLRLPNVENKEVLMYIGYPRKIPVPKYFWKILYDPESKDGIVFVNINNPFAANVTEEQFCENICEKYGWGVDHWNNVKKGYIFCCEINEFRKRVQTAPELNVTGIFLGVYLKVE